jgi:trimeric autotransporter adhesin
VGATFTRYVTAAYGGVTRSAPLTLTPSPRLTAFSLSRNSIEGGLPVNISAALSGPAPSPMGIVVSSESSAIQSTSIQVPQGASSGNGVLQTSRVGAPATRTVRATLDNVTINQNLTLNPAADISSIAVNPSTLPGGSSATGTVTLTRPAYEYGAQVSLSSNSIAISVPATVTVPSGATSATFTITTQQVAASATRTITATRMGISRSVNVTLTPMTINSFTCNPTTVKGGQNSTGTIVISNPAPAGGLRVNVTASSSALIVPATVTVPAGQTSATFTIGTTRVGATYTRQVAVQYGQTTRTVNITLTP